MGRVIACNVLWIAIVSFGTVLFSTAVKISITMPPFKDGLKFSLRAGSSGWDRGEAKLSICAESEQEVSESYFVTEAIPLHPAKEITMEFDYKFYSGGRFQQLSLGLYFLTSFSKFSSLPNPYKKNFTFIAELKNATTKAGNAQLNYIFKMKLMVDSRPWLYIALRDNGSCTDVFPFKLTYYQCPEFAQLLKFPPVASPNTSTAEEKVMGSCVANAEPLPTPSDRYMVCYSNGTAEVFGSCQCLPGYENSTYLCTDCPQKTFKDFSGNLPCKRCGANVVNGRLPRKTVCQCKNGFYRPTAWDVYNVDCEGPPSPPQNLSVAIISATWVLLEWIPPHKLGTGGELQYKLSYGFTSLMTKQPFANLTGLDTFADYEVTISSRNNVTDAIGIFSSDAIRFKTMSGLPSAVTNLRLMRNIDDSVTVFWDEPSSKGGLDLRYFFAINNDKGRFIASRNYTVYQKEDTQKYTFSVKSHTSAGFSSEQKISFSITGKVTGIPLDAGIGIGIAFFIILLITIGIGIAAFYYKRRNPKHLRTIRLENGKVVLPSHSGSRLYVDPTTYQDVTEAVEEFANQLDRDWVEIDQLIGSGEFGDVFKGVLRRPSEKDKVVAVKSLKSSANNKARDDFLCEAAYMGQFDDANVISIEGVIVRDRPVLIVLEFMGNGSLDSYLQKHDGKFSPLQLLGMARGVASGMTYLSEMMFIHRDLAARNVLVNESMICKVADFGMSRELQKEEETYNTTGGKIPVRWTAPEAIQYKKFTIASDVWSYGVLLWEIMSYGERPYWDWGNYEVLERLASGYRLPPPMSCPKVVHDLMLSCWQKSRVKRPKFRDVRTTIDKWIRSPELLKTEESVVTRRDENLDYASMKTLKEWLDSIGLGHYIDRFTDKGLVTPRQILELGETDLIEIGIPAIGHRNKILKSISKTKGQLIRSKSLAI